MTKTTELPDQTKRLGFFATMLVATINWLYTFYYCFLITVTALLFSKSRPRIDKYLKDWSRGMCKIINLKVNLVGNFKPEDNRRYIVLCNHSSIYDIPVSFLSIDGSLRMLAKKELFRIPILSRAMKSAEIISIDRQNKEQAQEDLAIAKAKMADGIIPWIAPEGTRSADGELLPFKKGAVHLALQTDAVIVPMVIKDIYKVLPKNNFRFALNQTVEVRLGEPVDATVYTVEQRTELTALLREKMAEMLKPELSND
ncbi:MAG: lysophospholipid acyltransferase family protein [Kangiellaceae bacterium]|jgi:1-acyl-sn-glycerol-3-phosphate acyltransferase|nr:lysophospholipid acyltransferase family protein [Kangiellaceae bacterium]